MITTDAIRITPEILALLFELDEFKGAISGRATEKVARHGTACHDFKRLHSFAVTVLAGLRASFDLAQDKLTMPAFTRT